MWATDHARRNSSDSVTPWIYGLLIAIAIVSLLTPAWRRHLQRAQDLWRGGLYAILQLGIFWCWFHAALVLVLWFSVSRDAPLAAFFIPSSFLFFVMAVALALHLAVPRLIQGGIAVGKEMRQYARLEREFLERVASNDEHLRKSAVEPVLRALAYRLKCNTADLAELTFDSSHHRRVNDSCWLMG